jgi:hypothetical protein
MGTNIRSLEDQLEPAIAQRLRIVQAALLSFRIEPRTSSYYLFEIGRALDVGMLLAALELSTTLLEIWVRDLLVIRKVTQHKITSRHQLSLLLTKIDREIEGTERGLGFSQIVKELGELEVLEKPEVDWLNSVYGKIRNSLHHGLSGRLIDPEMEHRDLLDAPDSKEAMFVTAAFFSSPTKRRDVFEEFIDTQATIILEQIVNFLAEHPIPKEDGFA